MGLLAVTAALGCAAGPSRSGGAAGTGGPAGTAAIPGAAGATADAAAERAPNAAAGSNGGGGAGDSTGVAGATASDAAALDLAPETPPRDTLGDAPATSDAASACKTDGTELCEDFESGALDPKVWGRHTTAGASLVVDGEHVHGGRSALHVKLVAGQQATAQITDAVTFPATDNTFYTRAYFYFSPDLPADDTGGFHMAFLLATGNNDLGFVEAGLGSAGDKQYLGYSEYYGAGPGVHSHGATFTEFGPRSMVRVAPKAWLCLELMQGGDATTTHRRVWVDGKELPEQVSNYSDRKPPKFDLMSVGILQYHPTPVLTDVWIDDVRVSRTRIGCDAAAQ
jgi:hypothetical protein